MQTSLSGVFKLFGIFMVGFLLVLSAELSATPPSSPPPSYNQNGQINNEAAAMIREACKDAKEGASVCMQKHMERMSGGDQCAQAQQQFSSARKDFSSACEKAGISGNCVQAVAHCQRCLTGGEGDGSDGCGEPGISSSEPNFPVHLESLKDNLSVGVSGWGQAMSGPDLNKLRVKYGNCPALAGTDYKSLQKEVEEGRKKIEDEKLKVIKIQEEINKLRTDHAEEYNKRKDELKKAEREWEEKRDDIDKKFFAENEALMKELQQKRDLNESRKNQIMNLNLKKNDEKLKKDQALAANRLSCNETALAMVSKLQASDYEKMKSSTFTAGDFNAMVGRAGLTSREQYQSIANARYNECIKGTRFLENKDMIEKSYRQQLEIINAEIARINKDIETTNTDMQQTLQTKLGQKKLEYDRDTQRADKEFNDAREKVVRDQEAADTKLQIALQTKTKELEFATANAQREEEYLKQKQQLLALKRQYSDGDSDSKSGGVSAAMSAFEDLRQGAVGVKNYCCTDGKNKALCESVKKYMDNVGEQMEAGEASTPASGGKGTGAK